MACREAAELCGMMWGWEHAGRAGRDIPWGLGEESSRHAVQLGRHSDDDLGLVRWSAPSISTSPKVDSDLPLHAEIRFAFVKKMDRLLARSHAHSPDIMQGGRA